MVTEIKEGAGSVREGVGAPPGGAGQWRHAANGRGVGKLVFLVWAKLSCAFPDGSNSCSSSGTFGTQHGPTISESDMSFAYAWWPEAQSAVWPHEVCDLGPVAPAG